MYIGVVGQASCRVGLMLACARSAFSRLQNERARRFIPGQADERATLASAFGSWDNELERIEKKEMDVGMRLADAANLFGLFMRLGHADHPFVLKGGRCVRHPLQSTLDITTVCSLPRNFVPPPTATGSGRV
jgi:hypothetical protein